MSSSFNHRLYTSWKEIDSIEEIKGFYKKHIELHTNCNKKEWMKLHKRNL